MPVGLKANLGAAGADHPWCLGRIPEGHDL